MDNKADINSRNSKSVTPLHISALNNHTVIVKDLLRRGAEIQSLSNMPEDIYATAISYKLRGEINRENSTREKAVADYKKAAEKFKAAESGFKKKISKLEWKEAFATADMVSASNARLAQAFRNEMCGTKFGSSSYVPPAKKPHARSNRLMDSYKKKSSLSKKHYLECQRILQCFNNIKNEAKLDKCIGNN